MALKKQSKKSDALANLYRAAFFLARSQNEEKLALDLLKKSTPLLSCKQQIKQLINNYLHSPKTTKEKLVLAEKILDYYLRLK